MGMRFNLEITTDLAAGSDVKILKMSGDLAMADGKVVKDKMEPLIEQGLVKYIVDLTNLKFIDSFGTLALINLHIKTRRRGGFVVLHGVNDNVLATLDNLGLTKIVPIYNSYADVVKEFLPKNAAK